MNGASITDAVSGKGANRTLAAARTGAAVTLRGVVGSDASAARIIEELAPHRNVLEASRLDLTSDRSTIVVGASGENFIVSSADCATAFDPRCQTRLAAAGVPTLVGSCFTPQNAGDIFAVADGVIIDSALNHGGARWNAVDQSRVTALMAGLRR